MLSQLMPLIQCGSRTCLCVFSPAVPFLLPGRCTSISHRWAFFCIECHRQTNTYWPSGLLFPLILALREVLQFGGNGLCALPKLEPGARQRGLAAPPLLRGHIPRSWGPWARLEGAVWQVMRSCFQQGPHRVPKALPREAYRSPSFSFSGPLLLGIRRSE